MQRSRNANVTFVRRRLFLISTLTLFLNECSPGLQRMKMSETVFSEGELVPDAGHHRTIGFLSEALWSLS